MKKIVLFILAITMLFCCSCQNTPDPPSDGEITEQPEPQRMAYHLGEAYRLGEDVYFVNSPYLQNRRFSPPNTAVKILIFLFPVLMPFAIIRTA